MHNLLGVSLSIGIIANLDNLGIGISYGLQKIRIPFASNLLIALMSSVATAFAMIMGTILSRVFPYANVIGALLLIAIGLWISLGSLLQRNVLPFICKRSKILRFIMDILSNPSKADRNANGVICNNEAIILGISLSLNCIVTGLGAGLSRLSLIPVILSVFFFSLITISCGYELGNRANFLHFGHLSEIISGVLLVALGIRDLI
ncbi:MAG: manganese efflux pump [Desulfosporosinus sp.]|nr:manganese efflux pump [Desulfosporosinus sp.]